MFGDAVVGVFKCISKSLNFKLFGFLARPLYACTSERGGEMCMSVASMSERILHQEGRMHYRCGICAKTSAGEPAFDSVPLRVLHLYALVDTGGIAPHALHSRPVRLVVFAPPADWGWGREFAHDENPGLNVTIAMPENRKDHIGEHWRYNPNESSAIWRHSGPHRGERA